MARLAIQKNVLRDLAIRSKNKCAFPGCNHPILNPSGDYIAELCHIEAAEPGAPRFNPRQSDEDRRSYDNLLFLCHSHHKETDDDALYPVSRMREIKFAHERLTEVVFDHELLLERLEAVRAEQTKIVEILQGRTELLERLPNYQIRTPWIQDAWTPDQGRFYESSGSDGTGFRFMTRDGWLHIEQIFKDGSAAYYEVNEEGSVRDSRMPYPINEYHVEIPQSLILRKEQVPSSLGDRAIRTVLKWSAGDVVEHYLSSLLIGVDCHARCVIQHNERKIIVLEPKST
jgi:hypothetical protein